MIFDIDMIQRHITYLSVLEEESGLAVQSGCVFIGLNDQGFLDNSFDGTDRTDMVALVQHDILHWYHSL